MHVLHLKRQALNFSKVWKNISPCSPYILPLSNSYSSLFCVITRMLLHISYIEFHFIGFCAFLGEDREGEVWECSCPPHFITCPKWFLVGILWRNFDPRLHCPLNFVMSWIKKWQFFWSHHSFQNFDLSKPLWADIHFKCSIVGAAKGTNLITLLINYLRDISIYGCTYHGGQRAGSLLLLKVCDCFSTSSKCNNLLNLSCYICDKWA
jgi:hypothetical protein